MQSSDIQKPSPASTTTVLEHGRRSTLSAAFRADGGIPKAAVDRAEAITAIVAGLTEDEEILAGAMLFPLLEAAR